MNYLTLAGDNLPTSQRSRQNSKTEYFPLSCPSDHVGATISMKCPSFRGDTELHFSASL